MPCRKGPPLDTYIEWIYVIDLDQNVFRVYGRKDANTWDNSEIQYFRLDNIPRWLFDLEPADTGEESKIYAIYPIMTASVENTPIEHWANYLREIPAPKSELLDFYQSLSPEVVFDTPRTVQVPTWRRLQIQLFGKLVEYFLRSFHDVCPSRKSSRFVIRQLAYAVLCLTRPGATTGMKFQITDASHKVRYGSLRSGTQTPSWEPPDSDSYWLGNVLIVLDEHIHSDLGLFAPATKAAIAKTVHLVSAMDYSSDSDVKAVIFSIYCVIIVSIRQTPQGPQVSHTPIMRLLCFGTALDALGAQDMKILRLLNYDTPGINALINLFATASPSMAPPSQSQPAGLPTELSQQIFRYGDPNTQSALEESCRLFRDMAVEHPRIGEWTLVKCSGDTEFVAFRSSTQSHHVVGLKPLKPRHERLRRGSGFEVGLWGCMAKLVLNMPLFNVEEVTATESGTVGRRRGL